MTVAIVTADDILDAAQRRFAAAGVRRSTIEDVAAEAGVSRITVYRHVGNRDELVRAVLLRVTDRFLQRRLPKLLAAPDLASALRDLVLSTVRAARRDDSLLLLYGSEETGASGRPLPGTTEPLIDRFASVVTTLAAELPGGLSDDVTADDAGEWVLRVIISLLTLETSRVRNDSEMARLVDTFAIAPIVAR